MTQFTPPGVKVEWEPITEGIELSITDAFSDVPSPYMLNMNNVREIMYDMEEAVMLSRGYTKHANVAVCDVPDTWIVRVMGNDFRIASTFLESQSKYGGAWYCLQDNEGRELVWPAEDLVTAYEPVS